MLATKLRSGRSHTRETANYGAVKAGGNVQEQPVAPCTSAACAMLAAAQAFLDVTHRSLSSL
jgi:hypothetical protein